MIDTNVFNSPEMLLLAAQTVGVVAYVRQHLKHVDGPWVFPVCLLAASVVCFAASTEVALSMQLMQRAVAVSVLAFGIMVLRRGGNVAAATTNHSPEDRGGPTPPPPFLPTTDHSPVANFMMHAIPLLILGFVVLPMVVQLIR